jgi:hypothetical protein
MKKFTLIALSAICCVIFAFRTKHSSEGRELNREIPVVAMAIDKINNGIECSTCHAGKRETEEVARVELVSPHDMLVAGETYIFEVEFAPDLDAKGIEMQMLAFEETTSTSLGGFDFEHRRETFPAVLPEGNEINFEVADIEWGSNKTNAPQTLKWRAPEEINGPVSINIAGLAANMDGTAAGDEAFGESITLEPAIEAPQFSVYPSQIDQHFTIEQKAQKEVIAHIRIFDLSGDMVFDFGERMQAEGENQWSFDLSTDLPEGMYLLSV